MRLTCLIFRYRAQLQSRDLLVSRPRYTRENEVTLKSRRVLKSCMKTPFTNCSCQESCCVSFGLSYYQGPVDDDGE